jgi:hypothetical protein
MSTHIHAQAHTHTRTHARVRAHTNPHACSHCVCTPVCEGEREKKKDQNGERERGLERARREGGRKQALCATEVDAFEPAHSVSCRMISHIEFFLSYCICRHEGFEAVAASQV